MVNEFRDAMHGDFKSGQRDHGLSASRVATVFGKSPGSSWPYQLMDGDVPMSVQMVHSWQDMTGGLHLMRWLARDRFIVAPVAAANERTNAAHTIREFAEYLEATVSADADGRISREEMERIDGEAMEAIGAILAEVEGLRRRASESRNGRRKTLRAV